MNFKKCVNELLISGCDDYIQAAEVVSAIISDGGVKSDSDDQLKSLCLNIVRHVLQEELMEIGDFFELREFKLWNLSLEESLKRIEEDWKKLGRSPSLWELFWLRNTPKGDEIGQKLLSKNNAEYQEYIDKVLKLAAQKPIDISQVVEIIITEMKPDRPEDSFVMSHYMNSLIYDGLMELGDLQEGNFIARDTSPQDFGVPQSIDKLWREWNKLGRIPKSGEIGWLRITKKGSERINQKEIGESTQL